MAERKSKMGVAYLQKGKEKREAKRKLPKGLIWSAEAEDIKLPMGCIEIGKDLLFVGGTHAERQQRSATLSEAAWWSSYTLSDILPFGGFFFSNRLSVGWLSSSQKDVTRTPLNPVSLNGSTLVILQDALDPLFINFLHYHHNRRSAAQLN